MGLIDVLKSEEYTMGVWRVEETETQLKELVGGDYFPGLAKLSHPRRRLEWLAARTLLREFGQTGHVLYHPTRRPFLANSNVHLSISHSFPFVAVIISQKNNVGIDIEYYNRPFSHVAHKYLSMREKTWINLNNNKLLALVWSAKEAVYKLPGMEGLGGIDMDVKPFDSIPNSGKIEVSVRIGGTVQKFSEVHFFYVGSFNVVWVYCNAKLMTW